VRRHVKASSAGSKDAGSDSFGRAFITRGGPSDSKGSGAPSSIGHLRSALAVLALAICALALTAAPAFAAPLGAKIGTVSNVLGGSVHVTGEVNPGGPSSPGGGETYFAFEYSTDNVNWSGFNFEGYETGEGFRPVSADLEGLKGGTKYFVRLTANNFLEEVSSAGPNPEFETLPVTAPSVLAIDNASQVGFTTAKASGEVLRPSPANPDPAFDAKCTFEYITDAQFAANEGNGAPGFEGATSAHCNHDPVTPADGAAVETILTDLAPETTYHLRLSASNAGGADAKVAAGTFTTQAIATAPTLGVKPAAEVQYSKAQISGNVNPNGGNVNAVGGPVPIHWELQYTRADEPANWQPAEAGTIQGAEAESSTSIAVPASAKQLEGLPLATEYKYRLSVSYAGITATSPEGSFTTKAATAANVPTVEADDATLVTGTTAHFSGHVTVSDPDPALYASCEFLYVSDAEFQPHNEQQRLFIGATGGTYTITFTAPVSGIQQTTGPVAFNAPAASVQSALQGLPGVGAGAVTVTGGVGDEKGTHPYTIIFSGPLAATNIESLGVDGGLLTVTQAQAEAGVQPSIKVTTISQGSQGFGAAQPIACQPNPVQGTSSVEVKADVGSLEPHTVYHLRLRAGNVAGTATDDANTFLTEPTAPIISATAAHEISATTTILSAQINPRGASTTFHFEYLTLEEYEAAGETLSGATSTPESASVGTDNENHLSSAMVEGLEPGTPYRFRVVATNEKSALGGTNGPVRSFNTSTNADDSCPNAAVRSQQGSIFLPDCRAYEMVSPLNKHGNFVNPGAPGTVATDDGSAIVYRGSGAMGAATRGVQWFSTSRRQSGGWSTEPAFSNREAGDIVGTEYGGDNPLFSPDLRAAAIVDSCCYVKDVPPGTFLGEKPALIFLSNADGSVDWLNRPQIPKSLPPMDGALEQQAEVQPVGGRPDFGTVYFWDKHTSLPSDAARTVGESTRGWGMYEYSGGVLKSAGTLPDGTESPHGAAPANSAYARSGSPEGTATVAGNQVSSDGSTLFFLSPDGGDGALEPPQLYVRRGGHSTLVSHAQDGTPAPSGVVGPAELSYYGEVQQHVFASKDGKTAIFRSIDALAPGASGDSSVKAYRYDVETDTVTYLPGVGGDSIVAASEDLHRFLFGDRFNGDGIRLWDEGTIRPIYSGGLAGQPAATPAAATPSGSVFIFTTATEIPGFNSGGAAQVYRYDVAHDKLTCVSCPPDDVTSPGSAGFDPSMRGMSADGGRVFFDTPNPLVPRDTNGVGDVYEWTPRGVSLITSGQGSAESFFLDNSADGNDVFFATREAIDLDDNDAGYDVYDARVDGGFLKPVVVPCSGEACRSGASAVPATSTAATKSFEGAGNQPQPRQNKGHKKKHHKKKAHKRAGHKRGGSK
jgi:hypothetical protein